MLNFITQQRRGTTEEWAKSTVIPQAGEFVIEERKNEPIRIKLGDGVHLFKDLKYIDQDTVSALTELEARYNAHVAYVEGGAPVPDSSLATEVIDARYIDGTSYSSLNAAIQGVSDKRVGGMVYDYSGELGLKQPYMLYLTDKDNNIIEETGVRIISGSSGGSGGGGASSSLLKIGYITTSPVVVTPDDTAILKFTFSGTDSSGDAVLQASATWKVDGKTVSYGIVKDGENEFDVTKYLKIGTTKVLLSVVDDSGGVVTKNWSVQQIDIRMESNFNDKITYPIDDILFDYIPYGAVDKTVYIKLDGEPLDTVNSPAKLSGNTVRYELPKQEHGSHLLEIYSEAIINDKIVSSDPVFKDILWYDSNASSPVIGTISQKFTAKQFDTTNIEYTVYDPSTETPEVEIRVDDKVVSRVTMTSPTNVFAFNSAEVGVHNITITCGTTVKTIVATIEKLDIDISPVLLGLAFDFNPVGKSNDDTDKLWSSGDINMTVSDNFDWINGGYKQDSNGDTFFCVKAGTTATINYNLFGDDAKKTGKEMKLIFKTENVANPDAIFMSCVDNTTDSDHIGINMGVHSAKIYGQNGKLELDYSENDIIEFEFNVSANTETVPMVMGYEDGVSTRPMVYDSSFNFKQNTPKPITFGDDDCDCDVHIYRMKVYSTSLTNVDILNNFIADARTTTEMRARYERNQIYDENQNLTPEVLAEKCPWLHVYKLSAPHFTNNKSDKVKETTIQQIYKGGDPVLDNWIAHNAQHSGQGTSSNNYGAAGRNLDFIMNKSGCYFELGDGTTTDKITLSRTSVPVAYLNAKVNIASSNNLTNAILANRYNRFNPYRRPFVREEGINIDYIKDTMEFYNCVIFIQETDPDLSTHREFADTDWHFYAIGNIGDSKKTDDTRVTDPNDPYECCVEIMDVGLPLSGFPVDTMINAMGYTVDETTGQRIYTWAKDENLDILYEAKFELTSDKEVNYSKTYYIDLPVKKLATASELTISNLPNLYDRVYSLTQDKEVVKDKVYYIDNEGTVATKDYLKDITNPNEAGLYEWNREYKKTSDTTIIDNKLYYVEVLEKFNAMEYTYKDVRNYVWAKDENLGLLYEFINDEYVLTTDLHVDLTKQYYIKVDERDKDGNLISTRYEDAMGYVVEQVIDYTYATKENLDKLYEITYYKTEDNHVDFTKTYYVDILDNDDFSENYTYGWRYLVDEEDAAAVEFCKQRWIEFYRFVTTSTDSEFKANLKNYFVVDSALYYYLFTTRYCMVDNRAKNTFWHYSKTEDGSRKWDLCWDYDNDTSLGLNNYGKQVYRYGLEDIDKDASNEEVFRQSDSLFFCRIRDLFAAELKSMYKTLDSANAWKAETLINEADAWQSQFPEELWRLDIERKYIRTYTSSFIDGKGDSQFLVNMANGKMKYHRRQWERSQEQYMASKYQTTTASGDDHHANLRVARFDNTADLVIQPNYQLTLTPYSYIYLTVWYGDVSRTPYTVRAVPNVPTTLPCPTALDADIINIGSAAAIRDFGDLSTCYPRTVSVGNATRVKKLKLGNDTEGYDNNIFTTLTTGSNPLLEELNLENISSLTQSLDLSDLINLKKINAFGTSATSVTFAEGGKLEEAKLPKLNSLALNNLMYLKTDKLTLENYDNVVDLTVESCPWINSIELLLRCKNLRRTRLIDVNIQDTSYDFFEKNLFKLKGLNSSGEETPNAWITGEAHFGKLTGSQLYELNTRYPSLKIKYDELTCIVTFKITPEDSNPVVKRLVSKNNVLLDCIDPVESNDLPTPKKESTVSHHYDYAGWSELPDGIPVTPSPLIQVAKDMTLYPTFNARVRQYTVSFFNNDNSFLNSYEVDYGTKWFEYPADDPKKALVTNPDAYVFKYWNPAPENILGNVSCYAVYDLKPDYVYELNLEDVDYYINNEDKTLCITSYLNNSEKIIKIPDYFTIEEETYTVTRVDGFRSKNLEFVILPETLTTIGRSAFRNNPMLSEVTIPESVREIYAAAFAECKGLMDIYYNATNATSIRSNDQSGDHYVFSDIGSVNGAKVHIGSSVEQVPSYVFTQSSKEDKKLYIKEVTFQQPSSCKSISSFAFMSTDISQLDLPESLEEIQTQAFNQTKLKSVILPKNTRSLGSDCFAYCNNLTYVYIPKSVTDITNVAFRCSFNIEFDIDPESKFLWTSKCFINKETKTLMFGREDSVIPSELRLTTIGDYAFNHTNIKYLNIPEGINRINPYAFHASLIEEVVLPSSLQLLSHNVFFECEFLRKINLPESLTKIDSFCFYECPIENLVLPEGLTYIGSYGLVDNPVIKTITIPANVTTIGTQAIRGCPELRSVFIKSNKVNFLRPTNKDYYDTFLGDTKLTYIEVNWASDGTSDFVGVSFENYNKSAPWKAGTDSSGTQKVSVTVKYTDKTLVYNTDGTITEQTEEQGD